MRKVTRTHFEDEDDDMVRAAACMQILLTLGWKQLSNCFHSFHSLLMQSSESVPLKLDSGQPLCIVSQSVNQSTSQPVGPSSAGCSQHLWGQ